MNWIYLVAIAVLADVFRVYCDNFITDVFFKERHAIAQRLFYGIAYLVIASVILIFFGTDFTNDSFVSLALFFLSGVMSSLAGIPYYRALECDDSTNLGIFFQFAPIFYLIFNWLFFGQSISPLQLLSIPVILAAPVTIILTAKKNSRGVRLRSMSLILFSMLIEVIGGLIFVSNNSADISFANEIAFVFLGHGLANSLMVLLYPKWRHRFFHVVTKNKLKVVIPMFFDSIASAAKTISYRAALIFAPTVALASAASDAVSPIAIFFAGIVLTLIWPNFGREKLTKKTVLVHLISTALVAVGIILMQL